MFLTRSHHEDIIREKNMQIGYRDHRIAELETERKLLWDKLCLLEIGEPIFNASRMQTNHAGHSRHPEPSAVCEVKELKPEAAPAQTQNASAPDCHSERDEKEDACVQTNHACNESHPEEDESCPPKDLNLPSLDAAPVQTQNASKYVRLGRPRPPRSCVVWTA